jgi:hypothetical protein
MAFPRIVLALLIAASCLPALAGEIIGNTYISEKDGVIEIPAEGWEIKDTEAPGGFKIAELTPREAIGGTRPAIVFFRLSNPGGAVTPEAMVKQFADAYLKQGGEVSPMEVRRIAGKRVLALPMSMSKDGGRANGLLYMLQGEKSLYWGQFFANVNVWAEAREKFDAVMEKVKY